MPPLAPSASAVVSSVTRFAVATSLVLKLAAPLAVTVSVPTSPEVMTSTGVAVVSPS
jgi:hypothetical protein